MNNVQHKIICKMSSWTKEKKNIDIENWQPTCENLFIVTSIELL